MATNTEKIVVQVVVKGEKDLQKVGKSADKSTKSFGKMAAGVAAAAAAFAVINKVVGSAINTFKGFEFQMAKVKATTGATNKDFKKLTTTAKQLGRTTFFTASQVGALQMNFAKLGFTTSEILDAQEATLRLATATGSDLARAAVVAGAAVRGFNLDASETERVVDVMAVSFTSSAMDIEKWQTSMTKVAPIAAGAGVSIESTAAIMGKLTDAGIEASIAGTSMRNIFLKMQDSSSDLSQHLGFTVNSSEDLERALIKLNAEGLSNEEIMGLVDIRQVAAFATMVNGTHSILDMTDALEDANGAAQEMADIMADTLEGDLITAKSAWEGFQIAIMTGSSDISKWLREGTQTWTFLLNRWSDNLKDTDDIAVDVFTNIVKIAKGQVKGLKELAEINKDETLAIPFSKSLEISVNDLEKTLPALEKKMQEAKSNFDNAWKDAPMGFGAESYDVTFEKAKKQFWATKQALKDLTEEIEVQKEKEVTATKTADTKLFIQQQQALRNKQKAIRKDNKKKEEEEEKVLAKEKEALAKEKADYKESQNAFDIALQEELNADKENLVNKLITQEEYDLRVFEAEQAHLENMKNLNIAYGEDTSAINGQILDNELQNIAKKAAAEKAAFDEKIKEDKEEKKERDDKIAGIGEIGSQLMKLAGDDEKYQKVREAGIKISAAAALATNAESLALQMKGLSADIAKGFPFNLIAIASTLALLISMKQNFETLTRAKGGMIDEFADGGMVNGKSHAQGGEKFAIGGRVVELEGGEAVINKRSTAMFRGQLSAMNSAGGGVKFADGGLLNMPSFSQQQFNALGQNQMMGAMGGASKVVVVEADITDSQNTVNVIQSSATI